MRARARVSGINNLIGEVMAVKVCIQLFYEHACTLNAPVRWEPVTAIAIEPVRRSFVWRVVGTFGGARRSAVVVAGL